MKRIAYSVSILNPGVSALDDINAMPLWTAVFVCSLLLMTILLLGIGAFAYFK